MSAGRAVRLLLLSSALGLAALGLGPPRFTWANQGVVIDHPRSQPAAALGAALALAAAALGARSRGLLLTAWVGGAALSGLAASRFWWRIEVVEAGLHARTLAGSTALRWSDVERVAPRDGSLTLAARDGTSLAIGTTRFAPDERVRLERTIARRVTAAAR